MYDSISSTTIYPRKLTKHNDGKNHRKSSGVCHPRMKKNKRTMTHISLKSKRERSFDRNERRIAEEVNRAIIARAIEEHDKVDHYNMDGTLEDQIDVARDLLPNGMSDTMTTAYLMFLNEFINEQRSNNHNGQSKESACENHNTDEKQEELIKAGIEVFQNLDECVKDYFLSAALVDDPHLDEPIISRPFDNFMVLHMKISQQLNDSKKECDSKHQSISPKSILKNGKRIWASMKSEARLPFFLSSYLATFYPPNLDCSTIQAFDGISTVNLNSPVSKEDDASLTEDTGCFV